MRKLQIIILLLSCVGFSQTPITDNNIHSAVDLWESNQNNAEATYGHISSWDTSSVTDMSELFESYTTFNEDIGSWDTSSVVTMQDMFNGAVAFNQDISFWDVSNVVNMHNMFGIASSFDQNISSWNVSNVTDMSYMFYSASNFNQDIGNWSIGSVVNMQGMFFNATIFNQNISSWNVSNVTDMSNMFSYAAAFNQDISSWLTSNVTDMSAMFNSSSSFDQNLAVWDISNVGNMLTMFSFSGLSTNNYDNILIGWEPQVVISNVPLGAIGVTYCTGETARQNLINNYGWTITDDGIDPSCTTTCPIDDSNIHAVVDLWVSNQTSAEATYGHISNWDTSCVTDMSELFWTTLILMTI